MEVVFDLDLSEDGQSIDSSDARYISVEPMESVSNEMLTFDFTGVADRPSNSR